MDKVYEDLALFRANLISDEHFFKNGELQVEPIVINKEIKCFIEGVKKEEVEYSDHKTGYDFFISYSTEDETVARKVGNILEQAGYKFKA